MKQIALILAFSVMFSLVVIAPAHSDVNIDRISDVVPEEIDKGDVAKRRTFKDIRRDVRDFKRTATTVRDIIHRAKIVRHDIAVDSFVIRMDKTIEILSTNNIDVTALEALKTDFENAYEALQTSDNPDVTKDSLKAIVEEFKAKAVELKGDLNLEDEVRAAKEAAKGELEETRKAAWTHAKDGILNSFDRHYDNLKRHIELWEDHGFDVTEIQTIADSISALRDDLETAIDNRDRESVRDITRQVKDLYREARTLHKDNVKDRFCDRIGNIEDKITKIEDRLGEEITDKQLERLNKIKDKLSDRKDRCANEIPVPPVEPSVIEPVDDTSEPLVEATA